MINLINTSLCLLYINRKINYIYCFHDILYFFSYKIQQDIMKAEKCKIFIYITNILRKRYNIFQVVGYNDFDL